MTESLPPRRIRLKPHQDRFITSEADYPALGGGWGNGKTMAGCVKANELSRNSPDNLGVIGRKHFTDLRDSTLADFLSLFGSGVRFSTNDMSATYPNGSKILFRHADKLGSLTNLNLGWFWLDQAEETTEDAFTFLVGRLRRKQAKRRQGFITFNMEGHNWIYRNWKVHQDADGNAIPNPESYDLVEASTLENRENLPEDTIRRYLNLPERVKARYVFGSWDVFEGQIYPMFQERTHVIDPFRPPHGWTVFEMGDHGVPNPTCWLWGAVDYDGNLFVFDEHYLAGYQPSTHAKAMLETRKRYGLEDVAYSVMDPSIEEADVYQYDDNGVSIIKGNNDVLAGINRVAELMSIDPAHKHPITGLYGAPRLYVTRNCVNLIRELGEYQWKVLKSRSSAMNPPDAPRKYQDHAPDALRYGAMSRPTTPERPTGHVPGSVMDRIQRHIRRQQGAADGDPMAEYR